MNREIKFRAWDKKQKFLSEPFSLKEYMSSNEGRQEELCWASSPELNQFTGLFDKNGKEIYEGDVVYLSWYGDYEVSFPFMQLYESSFEWDIWEILWNIYENPELLSPK